MSSIISVTAGLPMGLMSSSAIYGATPQEKLKSCCKALEGLFASEMLKEVGQSDTGVNDPAGEQYGDFIQQALTQSVTAGHGLGLADMLQKALSQKGSAFAAAAANPTTPAKPATATTFKTSTISTLTLHHGPGTH
jgi:Rod binding domain-containing protein